MLMSPSLPLSRKQLKLRSQLLQPLQKLLQLPINHGVPARSRALWVVSDTSDLAPPPAKYQS